MQEYLYKLATDENRGFIAGIIKAFLFILSFIYGSVVRILILFSRLKPHRLNCKVISVGNITLGGTGKTSLVEYIARYLKQQGHKVAILSRGYKRRITQYAIRNTQYATMGDEPYMLSKKLGDIPVIVDANRIRGAKQAIKEYRVDTVILDDGFQQWKIKKDLEITTIDVTDPFGNQHLLPRGILREPLTSLKRSDVFILTKTNLNPDIQDPKDFLSQINPAALILESIHKPLGFCKIDQPGELLNTEIFKGKTVTLFCGIADPDSFEDLIMSLGIKVGLSFSFPDHYNYSQKDLDKITQASKEKNIDTIVTTEKDAARLYAIRNTSPAQAGKAQYAIRILILRIELEIKDEQEFHNRLLQLYSG